MAALRVLRAIVPVAILWVGKLIIDEVVLAAQGQLTDTSSLWQLIALEFLIVVTGEMIGRSSVLVESLLGDLFTTELSVRLMRHVSELDLAQLEDPGVQDQMERARQQSALRINLLAQLFGLGQDTLTLATLGAALALHNPLLLLLLVAAVAPGLIGETHYAGLQYSLLYRRTPQRRQLDYLRLLASSEPPAKEVQVLGLGGWLIDRYRRLSHEFLKENKRLSIRRSVVAGALSLLGVLSYYLAYVSVVWEATIGAITLGTLVFLAAAFARSRELLSQFRINAAGIYGQSLHIRDLFEFLAARPQVVSAVGAPAVPRPISEGIAFEEVGFRYPDSDQWALRNVSLRIRPGECLALVGENGAGKTTLTKLLARLYDPTEGRITLDGRDLRAYSRDSVRAAIGVIFQDFVRYQMTFGENIGVGEIEKVRTVLDGEVSTIEGTPSEIRIAAEKSLAHTILPRLPGGYQQLLGRWFEHGMSLSGGEWQKLALARAYIRDSQILILDEPTAALDARAEVEVFKRFSELLQDRVAVIVSHRFSTVRMADRIVVLKDGRLIEHGSHEALVASGGLYADLFALQAQGYR